MAWVARLMPKEEQFFPLFKQHADRLANAAGTLKSLLDGGAQTSRYCEELNRIEKDADKSARKVLDAVRSTFVTPFNRVDIKSLISEMDGCLQNMRKTGRAASLFAFDRFEPCMQEIGDVIVEFRRPGKAGDAASLRRRPQGGRNHRHLPGDRRAQGTQRRNRRSRAEVPGQAQRLRTNDVHRSQHDL